MPYQLVLHFRGGMSNDLDSLIELENELIGALGGQAEVDGHDFGSGECNIFIVTENPRAVFDASIGVLNSAGRLSEVRAACRDLGQDEFTVIWPPNSKEPFEIA